MAIFDILGGEFIEVIEWTDDTRDTMVWRYPTVGNAIKYGAKLTVREGQAAVFIHEGQLADTFGPGLYMLETNNLPILTRLQHWDHGFRSPFKSEIYFISTTRFNDLKWGTKNPVMTRDAEFGPVRLRAFGTYSIAGSGIPVLDMAANTGDLGRLIAQAIEPTIAAYGLSIPEFYIENISLPQEVEKMLDKRTSMGILGDLDRFGQYAASEAMVNASQNPGSAGAGMGAAMGAVLGAGMANRPAQGPWGSIPQGGATPPPLPGQAQPVWHVALNGKSEGPFDRAGLERLATEGRFMHETLVWAPGQDGWRKAGEIPELAALFPTMPPPLPG